MINLKNAYKLSLLQQIAQENHATLLENAFLGHKEKHRFSINGQEIQIRAGQILSNGWPNNLEDYLKRQQYHSKKPTYKLKELADKASSRGGKLVDTKWLGIRHKYTFEDCLGNSFKMRGSSVLIGHWKKDGLIVEPSVRQVFEHIFSYNFPSTRDILTSDKTNTHSSLELDGYCEELKIAFEYQGYPSHWDEKHVSYQKTVHYDNIKKKVCKELGIALICIPKVKHKKDCLNSSILFDHVYDEIKNHFQQNPRNDLVFNLSLFELDLTKNSHAQKMFIKYQEYATQNGGKMISERWHGASSLHVFEFHDGRQFTRTPNQLITGGWPKNIDLYFAVSNSKKERAHLTDIDRYEEIKQIAIDHNDKLLENSWKGFKKEHQFSFSDGRTFYLTPMNLIRGGWPKNADKHFKHTATNKLSYPERVEKLRSFVESYGGKLLDNEWKGERKQYKFMFSNGEIFETSARSIMENGWPENPDTYLKQTKAKFAKAYMSGDDRINELRLLAEQENGKLISNKWEGIYSKYTFEFSSGVQFEMYAKNILRNGFPKNEIQYLNRIKKLTEKQK